MTVLAANEHYMLPAGMPTAMLVFMAAAGVAAWVAAHTLKRRVRIRWARIGMFFVRVGLGTAALLAATQVIQRFLVLGTSWPIWLIALLGGACVEALLALYALERRTVSRRAGLSLACFRVALVLLVVLMLTQPVKALKLAREFQRHIAILIDNSASMHVSESQMTGAEKIRQAHMLGIEDRPYQFDTIHQKLLKIHRDLTAQHEWLATIGKSGGESMGKQLADRVEAMHERLQSLLKTLSAQIDAMNKLLTGPLKIQPDLRTAVTNLKADLHVHVRRRMEEAARITEDDDPDYLQQQYDKLKDRIRQAAIALGEALPKLQAVGDDIDMALYESLGEDKRKKIDALADKTRLELAKEVLLRPRKVENEDEDEDEGDGKTPLLARLQKEYSVKLYTFASKAESVDVKRWRESKDKSPKAADLPARYQETNLAGALQEVMTDLKGSKLAGILVLTDGQHNTPDRVEEFVNDRVPLCSVVFGGKIPPRDAAIVSIEPPETVYAGDKMNVKVELKLDGLAGQSVRVGLYDGKERVADETLTVPNDRNRMRKKIELSAEPKETGQHNYSVKIEGKDGQPIEGEAFDENNQFPFTVSVSRDKTKLLIVDGRPRWEFRYLKNLFDGRDRTVRLQYVLLEPDRILGQPLRPEILASASRAEDQTEATALPKDVEEWLKFDVIILGDIAPELLGADGAKALRKFVMDRGGTLIVISGQRFMPHAYAGDDMREMHDLLPVELVQPPEGADVMPSGDPSFRIALTDEGRDNIISRQHVDPKENQAVWNSLPDVYWRYPGAALEDARVLAYAMPAKPPDFVKKAEDGTIAGKDLDDLRDFQRRRALITLRSLEPGKVMFLSFDRTWRLRYRVGDTYHHKFWGQVLRWATASKLPAGTDLVKIGTSRSRYSQRQKISVTVKIVREDFSPVKSDEVAVNVFADGKKERVLRKKLTYVPDSPGIYTADLGMLPSGSYRAELDAPVAKDLLARDNVEKIAASFSVDPSAPAEQIELSANRGLLNRLATLTGGMMTEPSQAHELLEIFGKNKRVSRQPRQYPLWDCWPLLVLIVLIAAAEWIVRKKVGLA